MQSTYIDLKYLYQITLSPFLCLSLLFPCYSYFIVLRKCIIIEIKVVVFVIFSIYNDIMYYFNI
jgi:hypothetical protein